MCRSTRGNAEWKSTKWNQWRQLNVRLAQSAKVFNLVGPATIKKNFSFSFLNFEKHRSCQKEPSYYIAHFPQPHCRSNIVDLKLLSSCSIDHSWQSWFNFDITLSFSDKPSSKFQLVVASVTNECSKGSSKKAAQCTMNNSRQSRSFIGDVSIDSWQCPREIDEVNFQQVRNSAST